MTQNYDIKYMQAAVDEAEIARSLGEVPIGAVIVFEGEIIGRGHNLRETSNDPTTHAEMVAIRQAAEKMSLAPAGNDSLRDLGTLCDVHGSDDFGAYATVGLRLPRSQGWSRWLHL